MKTPTALQDRPRLMALVFGLRLCVLSLAFLAVAGALFFLGLSAQREYESLLVLYSIFQLLVALVLIFIRLKAHVSRVLLLAPILAILFPSWKLQLFGGLIAAILALEGLRLEASSEGSGRWFIVCEALLAFVILALLALPNLILIGSLVFVIYCLFGQACWQWQKDIKAKMKELD